MKVLAWLLLIGLSAHLYVQWRVRIIVPPTLAALPPTTTTSETSGGANAASFAFSLQPRDSYGNIAQRTLFSATRRPAVPDATPPEEPKPPEEDQSLDGVALQSIVIYGDKSFVRLKDPQVNKTLRLEPGKQVRGWTIKTIAKDNIELLSPNGKSQQISLRIFRPSGAAVKAKAAEAAVTAVSQQTAVPPQHVPPIPINNGLPPGSPPMRRRPYPTRPMPIRAPRA